MRIRRFALATLLALLLSAQSIGAAPALAQTSDDLAALNRQVVRLYQAGKLGEAIPIARRAVALAERTHGPSDPNVGTALNDLAELYRHQGRYAEAEPLYKRALAIWEKALGPDHPGVGRSLNDLAVLYERQGRYGEAEKLYKRALAIVEKALGPDDRNVGATLNNLATVYRGQGRYGEAEPLYKRALAIWEKALGPNHPDVAAPLSHLAGLYREQGRYFDAEPLSKRALAIQEKALGLDHPEVGTTLNNLAELYREQGRAAEAEPLYKRSLTIAEKALGLEHPDVGTKLDNLALLYKSQGRYAEAEPLHRRAIAILERALGPHHPDVGISIGNLANLLVETGRASEADSLRRRELRIMEKARGPHHPDVGTALSNLAWLHYVQGRYGEAEPLYQRARAIWESALGPDHPLVGVAQSSLAQLHFVQRDWKDAANSWRQSTGLLLRRSRRGTEMLGAARVGTGRSETERASYRFRNLVKATHRVAEADKAQAEQLAREMFQSAQWAHASESAASLAQMAARQAKGSGSLATLVRERQDLVGEWQRRDKLLIAAVSQPPDKRNAAAEQEHHTRLAAIDARIADIDGTLAEEFPEYAALASPQPLAVGEVQGLLRSNEALVLFLDTPEGAPTPEETFIWVVTKTDARWVRSEFGTKAMTERVAALRCGLDSAAWDADGARRCGALLHVSLAESPIRWRLLPFDLARAHELYRALFGQIQDLIRDKHLLIVPSGPLTSLPFQVLVTENPEVARPVDAAAYAKAAWLAKRQPISVLPSVASLKALRQLAKTSKATQPFIGFGNPLLLGPAGNDRRAWEHQSCKAASAPREIASRRLGGAIPRFYRDGFADIGLIRRQYPLPETADELCAVAQSMGAEESAVYLGAKASEKTIKTLSANGTLANARVVHFATHGLLAGETEMMTRTKAEPALLLTPPDRASEEDDGLLTASEIAQLKLDADWVVLSACNTAASDGDKPGAEALSGLARAFFYSGARALLVSHWAVSSEATVKLITRSFAELKGDTRIGRSEAVRRSMLALIDGGDAFAHPAYWSPFVVVGEGAR
jgi:CHAT domain-containing protein/tetratricopeptide (TPR) repeat protein